MARHSAAAALAFHRFDPAAGTEAEAGVNHPVVVKPEPAEKSSEKLHHTPAAILKPVTSPHFASRNSGGWASGETITVNTFTVPEMMLGTSAVRTILRLTIGLVDRR